MPYFTEAEFSIVAKARAGGRLFEAVVAYARQESKIGKTTSVFVSHAHAERGKIAEATAFLKGMNVEVYVDWADETMPEKTSGVTAMKIRHKIVMSDRFLLIATNAAVSSKWCNWELGIGDAFKASNDKLVILPLADNRGNWIGNEYIQVYPRVEPVPNGVGGYYDNIFRIVYPDGKTKWLDDWLKEV
ncbi:MAG TPA: toll/interleukin-1 receptor domain-containing protein [Flavobacteriales bacterium]